MLRTMFFAATLVALAACSAGGPRFEAPQAPPDKAVIWLFRPSSIVGGGNTDHVAINGKLAASLDNGEYIPVTVDPGPVTIQHRQTAPWIFLGLRALQELDGFYDALTLTAEPGRNYFIEFSQAEQVDAERAASRIGGMTQVGPPAG